MSTKAVLALWFAALAANAILVPIGDRHPIVTEDRR
jgi:hypothetical protein